MPPPHNKPIRDVVPAQLGFLAIYNPSLGPTDETLGDQIVYYYSSKWSERKARRRVAKNKCQDEASRQQTNEKLRQVGMAQGMIEYGRNFSDGRSLDSIDTERSRIVLRELELGWWVLASINLTIIPGSSDSETDPAQQHSNKYCSRDVKPAVLLSQELSRAHSMLLMHHDSLSSLFSRNERLVFMEILEKYWDMFISSWSMLIHGNPVKYLYNGIKIAACGELGMGVGEEHRGSGERDVLEGFPGRVEGLVDVIVSKFGDDNVLRGEENDPIKNSLERPDPDIWIGAGHEPDAKDGVVYLGTGALSRNSLVNISHWMEDLYQWGIYSYSVMDSKAISHRARKRITSSSSGINIPKNRSRTVQPSNSNLHSNNPTSDDLGLLGREMGKSSRRSTTTENLKQIKIDRNHVNLPLPRQTTRNLTETSDAGDTSSNLIHYLKLGFGTYWSFGEGLVHERRDSTCGEGTIPSSGTSKTVNVNESSNATSTASNSPPQATSYFLASKPSDVDDFGESQSRLGENKAVQNMQVSKSLTRHSRFSLRTLLLERGDDIDGSRVGPEICVDRLGGSEISQSASPDADTSEAPCKHNHGRREHFQAIVYVNRPFIFLFLFEQHTKISSMINLYESLHHQIQPIIKPLSSSTMYRAVRPEVETSGMLNTPIYDMVWDARSRKIMSNIPNIPNPAEALYSSSGPLPWGRSEAINVHIQIIKAYTAGHDDARQVERTCKTDRDWWIFWARVPFPPHSSARASSINATSTDGVVATGSGKSAIEYIAGVHAPSPNVNGFSLSTGWEQARCGRSSARTEREVILLRRSSEVAARSVSRFASGASGMGSEGQSTLGLIDIGQGMGFDSRRYVEYLMSVNT
ncbi:Bgt-5322 [Blumeria graminis f. sp. tritici]|uniref:Bgt-5322 n=2 Tax=Blumeria graminis f. sp. tritici TaxID=62690 RepID=A0A061HNB6_BLUGR|nr:hypothetical protein BGT96224_5322 [Blumeria graminis f. sp. tritici 96224]VCU40977.1 Bgt-5322 [Blumeria graminis f. sp. tritici]